ncbi:MAG: glutamate formimidoyltransferase [Planctomycetes bacterium]|nr:glutamate formimidoyltransferase [Planctomycetota bacterium]
MRNQLIECVPNFSEGRDLDVIKQITDAMEAVDGVKLLDVDAGQATNRTVVTLVGPPDEVVEAAVRGARVAAERIDMSKHSGQHPRFGAMDVCPLVPVSNITMAETVPYAHTLARRLGEEIGLTIYCYEHAARTDQRRNLAVVRSGEYEGLAEKLKRSEWAPDFGPASFNARSGATAVGARDFLVAYNVNLNTTSTRRANAIAFDVREKGRKKREGNALTGPVAKDAGGHEIWIPGACKSVKGIGWYIQEYGIAQVSLNLTNITMTPVHVAFDACCEAAQARGVRVTGSELVGLIPLEAMLDAGRYFLKKQQRSTGVSDKELVKIAVKSLGLDDLYPFNPDEKIIEYAIADGGVRKLVDLSMAEFVHETASESPAPGGGSIAASMGAMAAALATMVANLSSHKRGWDERWEEFSDYADKGKEHHDELLRLIDEDTDAFNEIMAAFGLPSASEEDKAKKSEAVQAATKRAIEIPFRVMQVTCDAMDVVAAMAEIGNPNSVSDAGVGALAARSAVMGAFLNVKINAKDIKDRAWITDLIARGEKIQEKTIAKEKEILAIVNAKF